MTARRLPLPASTPRCRQIQPSQHQMNVRERECHRRELHHRCPAPNHREWIEQIRQKDYHRRRERRAAGDREQKARRPRRRSKVSPVTRHARSTSKPDDFREHCGSQLKQRKLKWRLPRRAEYRHLRMQDREAVGQIALNGERRLRLAKTVVIQQRRNEIRKPDRAPKRSRRISSNVTGHAAQGLIRHRVVHRSRKSRFSKMVALDRGLLEIGIRADVMLGQIETFKFVVLAGPQ